MRKLILLTMFAALSCGLQAQRFTDIVDRGIVAVPSGSGFLVSWRIMGEEYYDTKFNLYRDGTKIASNLTKSNFLDASGSASATYQVEPIVRGVVQDKSKSVQAWANQYWEVKVQPVVNRAGVTQTNAATNGTTNDPAGYTLNDVSLADVDGDGVTEFIVKRNNDKGNRYDSANKTDFNLYECYKMDGTRLWWIDLGPNLMAGPDEQWDLIGYDWDQDGKAEVLMRGADNMIIHTATGKTINVGNMNYYAPRDEYTRNGAEYLLYLNGATAEPYLGWDGSSSWTPMDYPLPRFEAGESDYATIWGSNDTGHRSCKHYFGAPYLDGEHPSIFLGRGCYTRHKFCALDVNPQTHELTQRWRWNCYDKSSPWFGNGFHNYAIADVDWDGRDEIVFGSMMIDDTGYGLSTTGYGHGDAQHCGDLDPYRWGQEQFVCLEGSDKPGLAYTNATTSQVYIQTGTGGDNGRCMAGNFTNDIPGSQGRAIGGDIYALSADRSYSTSADSYIAGGDLNMRIYWDGDLCDEIMNSPGVQRAVKITKWGNGRLNFYNSGGQYTPTGILNNSSKNNPSAQGDILGDWREELVLRTSHNDALHVYTTNYESDYGIYTLWHDHQYRNAMAWQCVGYNQPPHVSYFLGELEGITQAPPPLMLRGRTLVPDGSPIGTTDDHLLICGYEDQVFPVEDGASPYILTINTPSHVRGTGSQQATSSTPKQPILDDVTFTTILYGGAFGGSTRIVKQGEGTLMLPNVVNKHTGETNVWNGTLQFDGTMEKSPVWLNRHTTLLSNGGKFLGGLRADYNATIYPGYKHIPGDITVSTLTLGFGSRIVLKAYSEDGLTDYALNQFNAQTLVIDTRDWSFGPKYKAPVLEFDSSSGTLPPGTYILGNVEKVTGNVADIIIEGLANDIKTTLKHEDGKLLLVVEEMRAASNIVWNGAFGNNTWEQAASTNFLTADGESVYSANGDDVVFNDSAAYTTINIKGAVSPASVTFENEKKSYTLNGDSIVGGGPITKNGAGKVTLNNWNHTGTTTINGGTMSVTMLANNAGQDWGSLGNAKSAIKLNDGATLQLNGTIITDQVLNVSGQTTIDVPSSKSVIFNKGIKGTGAIVTKTGAGSMEMLSGNTFAQLVIKGGTVTSNENNGVEQLPKTVEFQGGTLNAANNESSNITNSSNYVVPKSKTGTIKCGFRSTYTGRLTGEGTFNVYTGGVRCYFDGNWSEFAGTIKAYKENRQNKKSYDPIWAFRNTYGLPNATLNVQADVRVSNEGKDIEIGTLSGSGTLIGSGQWILGGNDKDFILSTEIGVTSERTDPYGTTIPKSASKLTKRGTGTMKLMTLGKINATLTVEGGTVAFNQAALSTFVNGSNATTVKDGGRIVGQGKFTQLTLQKGAELKPCGSLVNETTPGTIKSTVSFIVNSDAVVNFIVQDNAKYSKLEAASLTMNGIVRLTLLDGYTPAIGDEFTLWTASSTFRGTPVFDLPKLSAGMAWDTEGLANKTGILRIVEGTSDPYDVNEDGTVDVADISAIIDVMAGNSEYSSADVNGDGAVDVADIAAVISEMAARARRTKIAE
ncbi:MAG: autotransporter-associated beta strand repeat-containing protein [Prevotella sp.]|nr:autotransporter-associated beta strand repeat-containing protein [Prevotella sp.]